MKCRERDAAFWEEKSGGTRLRLMMELSTRTESGREGQMSIDVSRLERDELSVSAV